MGRPLIMSLGRSRGYRSGLGRGAGDTPCPQGSVMFRRLAAAISLGGSGALLFLGLHEYELRSSPQWAAGGMRTMIGVICVLLAVLLFVAGLACCLVSEDSVYELQD